MPKDAKYHEAAVKYNEELAKFAENLANDLEDEEVARWCRAVAKQHRYHLKRHRNALHKIETTGVAEVETEDGSEGRVVDIDDVDTGDQVVHRSAEDGQFVTEEEAEQNPSTTVRETVDTTPDEPQNDPSTYADDGRDITLDASPVNEALDAARAAQPVSNTPTGEEA